jgi:hypothetical protein
VGVGGLRLEKRSEEAGGNSGIIFEGNACDVGAGTNDAVNIGAGAALCFGALGGDSKTEKSATAHGSEDGVGRESMGISGVGSAGLAGAAVTGDETEKAASRLRRVSPAGFDSEGEDTISPQSSSSSSWAIGCWTGPVAIGKTAWAGEAAGGAIVAAGFSTAFSVCGGGAVGCDGIVFVRVGGIIPGDCAFGKVGELELQPNMATGGTITLEGR